MDSCVAVHGVCGLGFDVWSDALWWRGWLKFIIKAYNPAAAEQVEILRKWKCKVISNFFEFFFFCCQTVLWFYAAARDASDGADSTDCFRITNSSYEYVKWLNRENEVQIQREGEREMKTCTGLESRQLIANYSANSPQMWHSCEVLRGMLVILEILLLSLCSLC